LDLLACNCELFWALWTFWCCFRMFPYYRSLTKMRIMRRTTLVARYNMLTWRNQVLESAISHVTLLWLSVLCRFWSFSDVRTCSRDDSERNLLGRTGVPRTRRKMSIVLWLTFLYFGPHCCRTAYLIHIIFCRTFGIRQKILTVLWYTFLNFASHCGHAWGPL